ncbi:MAG: flavodoxin [Firmicutes bacterium]|nr:flavodoxin [Bacillota bacterium]MBR3260154.1 flavodoxin [Bacillota bacterium]MBR3375829.1 flavodoxin [Bacillota bacterium]
MKKFLAILLTLLLVLGLVACGGSSEEPAEESTPETTNEAEAETPADEPEEESTEPAEGTLVVYFSMTGTTRGVAEKIAAITGADIYEIKAAQEYTSDDLNYNDPNSRTSIEQDDETVRPEIGSDPVSLDGYTTVYIGYPIWWGEEPRIMDTFVESYNFDGKTVIPFCTSGSSSIGNSGKNLAANAGSGNWLDGQRFSGSTTEDELRGWIEGLQ